MLTISANKTCLVYPKMGNRVKPKMGKTMPDMVEQEDATLRRAIGQRIDRACKIAGGTSKIARKSGVPISTIGRMISGESEQSAIKLMRLAKACNVPVQWLISDEGLPESGTSVPENEQDAISIPILNVRAAAGAGAVNGHQEIEGYRPFSRELLRSLGIRSDTAQFVRASGDSMWPTIEDHALALVDRSRRELVDAKVFVVSLGEEVRIKRIHKSLSGKITLQSDNDNKKLFPDEPLSDADIQKLKVGGQVLWTERLL